MTNVYVTSDQHFGHKLMADIRGFSSVDEHDAYQIDAWNSVVGKRDIVYQLGDVFLGRTSELESVISQLNGTIHLITGNHDACWPAQKRSQAFAKRFLSAGFDSIQQYITLTVRGRGRFFLSHFPYNKPYLRDSQYRIFSPNPTPGMVLIHGHTHSSDKIDRLSPAPAIHVGIDAWQKPVRLLRVASLMDKSMDVWEDSDVYWRP